MNILIPYSWIKDFLKTEVKPEEVFRLTTACGPTIESFEKTGDDYILNIEVTINRPDCLSVLGIAREMYTVLKQNSLPAKLENDYLSHPPKIIQSDKKIPLKIKIDQKLCPRFAAVILSDIAIGPPPNFIKNRLEKSGMRSLNNVIDITNYVTLELGQPNHAFDWEKIKGKKLSVRAAKKGENVLTLDGKKRTLQDGDIIYEDGEGRIIDLSGIIGGGLSEINPQTKTLFYTVVNFYFAQIRKTSMRLGIQTEASARFSKKLDQEIVYPAMLRAINLFTKYAGAKMESEILDLYPKPQKAAKIKLTDEFIKEKIGLPVPPKTTDSILKNLGFYIVRSKSKIVVTPPSWRTGDVTLPEDVVEEVARIVNYDQIPNQPLCFPLPEKNQNFTKRFLMEDKIRQLLVAWGFIETISFSMLSKTDLEKADIPPLSCIKIINPLTEEWEYMQPNLTINFLKNVAKNQSTFPQVMLFEIANVFDKKGAEKRKLIIGSNKCDFYKIKGFVEQIISALHLKPVILKKSNENLFDDLKNSEIYFLESSLGYMGEIKHEYLSNFQLESPVFLAELDLGNMLLLPQASITKSIYIFTPVIEDITLDIPKEITYEAVFDEICTTEGVEKAEMIDKFNNYFTFRIFFNSPKKQLSKKDVIQIRENLLNNLQANLNVQLKI